MDELLNEETPVQEDLAPPAEEPQETVEEQPQEEPQEEQKEHEPKPDSPRWKEIYWQNKEYERKLKEQEEVLNELKDHNRKLDEAFHGIRDEMADSKRPDPAEDPEGFASWLEQKIERKYERQRLEQEAQAKLNEIQAPAQQHEQPSIDPLRATQIAQMEATHGRDYYQSMIALVASDLKADPMLNREIMTSDNPPAAAFEYAQKKLARIQQKKTANRQQSFVEEDSPAPKQAEVPLTNAEKKTAQMLGISEKDYMEQKRHIEGV